MKYIFIIILIITSLIVIMDIKENYHTYFNPFLNENNKNTIFKKYFNFKNNLININFIKDNIIIGYYNEELVKKIKKILILGIKNKNFLNFTLQDFVNNEKVYEELKINNINLGCISNFYIYNNINKINNSIEFICNIATPTVYMCYSTKVKFRNIKSIYEPNLSFITTEQNKILINFLLGNKNTNITYLSNVKDLVDYFYTGGNDIIMFIDENPSSILNNLINNDPEDTLQMIPINYKEIENKFGNFIFNKTFIEIKSLKTFNINIIKNNLKFETIYYFESIYCNKYSSNNKYIYKLLELIYNNKYILEDITLNNISTTTGFIPLNYFAIKFYTKYGLISDNNSNYCKELIGKKECNKDSLKYINDII